MDRCPSPVQLERLLAERLSGRERDTIEAHVEVCGGCQAALERLVADPVPAGALSLTQLCPAPEAGPDQDFLARLKQLRPPRASLGASDVAAPRPAAEYPFQNDPPIQDLVDRLERRRLGQYQILEKLGKGSMGVVYKALHTELGKIVALKVLPAELMDEVSIARFKNEIRAVGKLDHPNIVGTHDAGQLEGVHFLVMAFVDGTDAARLVERHGPLPIPDACEVIRQAAVGLQHAFERGLVHRDIKPSNLMLTRDGVVKVLDLGLARSFGDMPVTETLTARGILLGTADYLAPEQWDNPRAVDTRADIYSLGCTLYHLLAGRAPFASAQFSSVLEKMRAHVEATPPPITRYRPEVPVELAAALDRMLAKRPADRFASPGEVAEALAPFTAGSDLIAFFAEGAPGGGNTDALPSSPAAETAQPGQTLREHPPPSTRPPPFKSAARRYALPAAVAGLCLAFATAIALWPGLWDSRRTPEEKQKENQPLTPEAKPLQILTMQASHHRGKDDKLLGDVGTISEPVRADDSVRVSVKLNAPAYCYVVAFNPDGTEQLCYPEDPDSPAVNYPEHRDSKAMTTPPPKATELRFPRDRFFRPDVAGLQAFVVVASTEPLPPYAQWRSRIDKVPWEPVLEVDEWRWQFDGREFERLPRERGRAVGGPPPPFRDLCRFFQGRRELQAVRALAFPVTQAEAPAEERSLPGEDAKQVEKLGKQLEENYEAGKYAEGLSPAREILALRTRLQGATHWETVIAKNNLETLERITALPKDAQDELSEATKLEKQVSELGRQGRYRDAIPIAERIVAVRQRHFGNDYAIVARSLNDQAIMCHSAGRYAEAETLFRQAVAICEKVQGDEHPHTVAGLANLALSLDAQDKYAEAGALLRRAVKIRLRVQGENHRDTAIAYNNLASHLDRQGLYGEAESLYRQALKSLLRVHREDHLETSIAYNNLGYNLHQQGKYAEADRWYHKALEMKRKLLGADHPDTALVYNNLAVNLADQGRYADAEPLYRKTVATYFRALGEEHPQTLGSCNNLALTLSHQGRLVEAEQLFRRALKLQDRPTDQAQRSTATCCNNLAHNLQAQGRYGEARELLDRALAIHQRLLGEDHADTAMSYNNLAGNLNGQEKYAEAEPLIRKTWEVLGRQLGEGHPLTAKARSNLGVNLYHQGRYSDAEDLNKQALKIHQKVLGEGHPQTAWAYKNLVGNWWAQGKYAEAEKLGPAAAKSFEAARRRVSFAGLERAGYAAENSPLPLLAAVAARNGKPAAAWQFLENNLARGLLDELSARPLSDEERKREQDLLGKLKRLDSQIAALLGTAKVTETAQGRAEELRKERDAVLAEFTQLQADLAAKHGVAAGEVYNLDRIQVQLPEDAALLAWVDIRGQPKAADPNGEHWACVVRRRGPPFWVKLPGSGPGEAWTSDDYKLAERARQAFGNRPKDADGQWKDLAGKLSVQRLAKVEKHLGPAAGLPAVSHLIVLPSATMRGIPVEALTDRYVISYAPSGTMFAWLQEKSTAVKRAERQSRPPNLLAVGDPVFKPAPPAGNLPPPPDHGVLITLVTPDSNAARSKIKSSDVLLRYADTKLNSAEDLTSAIRKHGEQPGAAPGEGSIPVQVWREGTMLDLSVRPGPLGVQTSRQPAAQALQAQREFDALTRASGPESFAALPGTRRELEAVSRLFPEKVVLLGSEASEEKLDRRAASGELGRFRFLHFATHGVLDEQSAMRSALILSQDQLADPPEVMGEREAYDGRLTAEQILRVWKLDADLVTLSACQTGLGKYSEGEATLAFPRRYSWREPEASS